jgi:hypothetical protein
MDQMPSNKKSVPLAVAIGIAAFGLICLFVVDHGPWSKPRAQVANEHYATTASAAKAAGATVTPTDPKPAFEPVAPGPKPAQPANPAP